MNKYIMVTEFDTLTIDAENEICAIARLYKYSKDEDAIYRAIKKADNLEDALELLGADADILYFAKAENWTINNATNIE